MNTNFSRRHFMQTSVAAAGVAFAGRTIAVETPAAKSEFGFSLNTSTVRGHKLSLPQQIELAAKAGYGGIEPWLSDVEAFAKSGGALSDLKKKCADLGLKVQSSIGFAQWVVNDGAARAKGVEQMKHDMDLIAQLGGTHIAAPPAGAYDAKNKIELDAAAERYRAILDAGHGIGIIPQLEFWGGSANLHRLDECLYVATRAAHPDACVLNDVFHLYKGGTDAASLALMSRTAAHNIHMNDFPANPPRETVKDSDRIWPGDGVAPIKEILRHLAANRATTWLSIELFNAEYWKMPAEECAKTGLEKMKACVAASAL